MHNVIYIEFDFELKMEDTYPKAKPSASSRRSYNATKRQNSNDKIFINKAQQEENLEADSVAFSQTEPITQTEQLSKKEFSTGSDFTQDESSLDNHNKKQPLLNSSFSSGLSLRKVEAKDELKKENEKLKGLLFAIKKQIIDEETKRAKDKVILIEEINRRKKERNKLIMLLRNVCLAK